MSYYMALVRVAIDFSAVSECLELCLGKRALVSYYVALVQDAVTSSAVSNQS